MDCRPPGSSVHGISRQEYWSGLFPSPKGSSPPHPGNEPGPPAFQVVFCIAGKFPTDWTTRKRVFVQLGAHFSWSYFALLGSPEFITFLMFITFRIKAVILPPTLAFLGLFFFFFLKDVDHFLLVSMEFVTVLLLLYVLVFHPQSMWNLNSLTRHWKVKS